MSIVMILDLVERFDTESQTPLTDSRPTWD